MNKLATLLVIILTCFLWAAPPATATDTDRHSDEMFSDEEPSYDDREYKFILGMVSDYQGWKIFINEGARVIITLETGLFNEDKNEISRFAIEPGSWIYTEGPVNLNGDIEAENIYLLPGRLDKNDYSRYPFIKIAPTPWSP